MEGSRDGWTDGLEKVLNIRRPTAGCFSASALTSLALLPQWQYKETLSIWSLSRRESSIVATAREQ